MPQIVKLNIGGKRYDTLISTIMKYPDSLLGTMIKQPQESQMIQDGEEIFIDRDGEMFKHIMRYLRDGMCLVPDSDLASLQQLFLEADFFKLNELMMMIAKKLRLLVQQGGWKVGDTVMRSDVASHDGWSNDWFVTYFGSFPPNHPVATIVQFLPDGKAMVRFEYLMGGGNGLPAMHVVNLKPKQA